MSAKELREAAEKEVVDTRLVLSHLAEGFIARQKRLEDRLAIAEHILATVREDDDEPVSWEWFVSIGGDKCYDEEIEGHPVILFPKDLCLDYHKPSFHIHSYRYQRIETRRQFRQLCEGLGIQLKETT